METFIERIDDQAAGFVTFYFTCSTFQARPILFIEDMFVAEEERGKGYGKCFFGFCRSGATGMRVHGLERAINAFFYKMLGAERW